MLHTFLVIGLHLTFCESKCTTEGIMSTVQNNIKTNEEFTVTVSTQFVPLVGGIFNASILEPMVIEAANYAMNFYYGRVEYKLISAQQQIVAGFKYYLKIQTQDGKICDIQTVFTAWLNPEYFLVSNTCLNKNK